MRSPAVEVSERRAGLAIVIAFSFLSICFTGQFPPFANPNELSRLQAVYAFVEEGTFSIDGAIARFGSHEDRSLSGGHFYSNKAPGLTFAAIPVYRLLRVVFPPPSTPFSTIFVLLRILVVTPLCVLAVARFHSRLRRRGARASALVTCALVFGTPFLFYSRSFFSHAWTAALLFLSLDLIQQAEEAGSRRRVGFQLWGAGVLAGWAAISEYPLAILCALLFFRCASRRAFGRAAVFAFGAALPLVLLLWYDAACFGSPFVLSSAREASPRYAELARQGAFGFQTPSPRVAVSYLVHPARGVLIFSPFFLWAAAGFAKWRRAREHRADWAFCLAATVLFFFAMTAYPNWHGGWSLGNRYLLPLLFPVGFALPFALSSPLSRWGFAAATVFSVGLHAILTSAWTHYPVELLWPARNGALWFLAHGWAAPGIFGDPPAWAPAAIAISLIATAVALVPSLASAGLPYARTGLAVATGAVVLAVLLVAAPGPDFFMAVWRAEIYGGLSGRDGALEELRSILSTARTPAERRRAEWSWRTYGPR